MPFKKIYRCDRCAATGFYDPDFCGYCGSEHISEIPLSDQLAEPEKPARRRGDTVRRTTTRRAIRRTIRATLAAIVAIALCAVPVAAQTGGPDTLLRPDPRDTYDTIRALELARAIAAIRALETLTRPTDPSREDTDSGVTVFHGTPRR